MKPFVSISKLRDSMETEPTSYHGLQSEDIREGEERDWKWK